MSTEIDLNQDVLEGLDEAWDLACEIPQREARSPGGWPKCPGRPAEWIAWAVCRCNTPGKPRYTLMCSPCKEFYDEVAHAKGLVRCSWCGAVNEIPVGHFEPLRRAS